MRSFIGTPISPGVAIGKAIVIAPESLKINLNQRCNIEIEKERFHEARSEAIDQIEKIHRKILNSKGEEGANILLVHIEMLEDSDYIERVEAVIDELGCNAEWAVQTVLEAIIELFEIIEDEYMKERVLDYKDISKRLILTLMGTDNGNALKLSEPSIIIASELSPSDTAQMNKELVLGIINEKGGTTSHAAIIARMLGIPFIICPQIMSQVKSGQIIALDGEQGKIELGVNDSIRLEYSKKKELYQSKLKSLDLLKGTKSITKDGYELPLAGNISALEDIDAVLQQDAQSIGLFRTEFLYMNRENAPEEEEQFAAYKKIVEKMSGKPVIIRTLDIGGDKQVDFLGIPKEENPFLGFRAIRLCLARKSLWKIQLRALLRASAYGDVHIMFPMIASMEELSMAKKLLKEIKEELEHEGYSYNENIPIGMMMETPAAAIMADVFAKEVDFFSIGTNDLIQYTMAVDRMNGQVAHLYSPYDPSVLRLIHNITTCAHENGIWTGICGEAAADKKLVPLWIGLGIDELSMSAGSVLKVRDIIQKSSKLSCEKLVGKILKKQKASEVEAFLDEYITKEIMCYG